MFSSKKLILLPAVFCGAFLAANLILLALQQRGFEFHYISSWPINVFGPSEAALGYRALVSLVLLGVFFFAQRFLAARSYSLPFVIVIGFAVVLGSNLIQGFEAGLIDPITEDEFNDEYTPQYYHDAVAITDAGALFRNYNAVQPTLHMHARTHPPGPLLLFYALNIWVKSPAVISLCIAAVAVALSAYFLHRLLAAELPADVAGFTTFLLLVLPSVQIYYLVTIDALVAGLLLGVFYCFTRGTPLHLIACAALFAAALMLTFVAVWILPVLLGFELITQRTLWRTTAIACTVTAVYVAVYFASGFDLLRAFRTASAIENEHGFMLLHAPLDYFVSRLQAIGEVILFFGPFLSVLFFRGVQLRRSALQIASALAIASFGLLLLAGTFRVGETARACNFLYPFLLMPVAVWLSQRSDAARAKTQLCWLVFGQAVLMQAAGSYFW